MLPVEKLIEDGYHLMSFFYNPTLNNKKTPVEIILMISQLAHNI
jgi:hypothetical protein